MPMEWFFAAWNLIYIAPFALALLYLGLYTVSGLTFGEPDLEADIHPELDLHADADFDPHADVEIEGDLHGELGTDGGDFAPEGDVSTEADTDLEGDLDHPAEVSSDAEGHSAGEDHADEDAETPITGAHGVPLYFAVLSWLGVGRIPLSILLMVLCLTWGVIGFCVNVIAVPLLPDAWMALLISLPVAALGSTNLTRGVMLIMSRWLPTNETYAHRRAELVGKIGETLFSVDEKFGIVTVRDERGDYFQVSCRSRGSQTPIPKGTKVLLSKYDANGQFFQIVEADAHNAERHPSPTGAHS